MVSRWLAILALCAGSVLFACKDDDSSDPSVCVYSRHFRVEPASAWARVDRLVYGYEDTAVMIGTFEGTAFFGTERLVSAGSTDVFLASLDRAGQVRWARRWGDLRLQVATDVAMDRYGNIYVLGYFEGRMDFGAGHVLTSTTYGSKYHKNVFLVKLNASGIPVWSRQIGCKTDCSLGAARIVVREDRVYVTGALQGRAVIDQFEIYSEAHSNYMIAVSSSGGMLWHQIYRGGDYEVAGITIDDAGHVYVAVRDRLRTRIYLLKWDRSGQILIERSYPGTTDRSEVAYDLIMGCDGHLMLSGIGRFGTAAHSGYYDQRPFIAGLETTRGDVLWIQRSDYHHAHRLVATCPGRGYTFAGLSKAPSSYDHAFVARVDHGSHLVWIRDYGKAGQVTGLLHDRHGRVIMAGAFSSRVNFGCGDISSVSRADLFYAASHL